MKRLLSRLSGHEVDRREALILLTIVALGLALRVAYVLATQGHELVGDEPEYHLEGHLITEGRWFWTNLPYGVLHEGMWKAPGYPFFVGVVYKLLGVDVTRLLLVQTLLGPITISLVWLLGRRLFDRRVALAGAALAAFYPHMWQWEVRMYPEGLALPLALLVMILVLERRPTPRTVVVVGLLMGLGLLVRPTQFFLFALVATAWWLAAGLARGTVSTVASVLVAAVVIAPWTIRNHEVAHDFIPISMQDSAAYGTFNDEARADPRFPWGWRPIVRRDLDLLHPAHPLPDGELRSRLQARALDYVRDNPEAVVEAFFWNGLSRTWDVRRPSNALVEVGFDGRTRWIARIGIYMWWVLLVAALIGLWRLRSRRELVLPLLAGALAASAVFTTAAATRYRLPLEPLVMLLALTVLMPLAARLRIPFAR